MKIFRKIRQELIERNRLSKYLLYAIGEIFLVVVGILIALSVNNWKEERKLRSLEVSYYHNLLADLQKDSTEFHRKAENAAYNEMKLLNILRFIDSGYNLKRAKFENVEWRRIVFKDTAALALSLAQAGFIQFPKLFENTMSDLRSTGNIKLLSNARLKNKLVIYYNTEKMYEDWNRSYIPNRTQIDLTVNRILPWKARSGYNFQEDAEFSRAMILGDKYDLFLTNIKNEPELRGLVVGMLHIQNRIIEQSFNRLEEVKEMIGLVSKEIDILSAA